MARPKDFIGNREQQEACRVLTMLARLLAIGYYLVRLYMLI